MQAIRGNSFRMDILFFAMLAASAGTHFRNVGCAAKE
jgi:hypothetical protein